MSEPQRHAIVAALRRGDRWLWIRRGPAAHFAGHWAPLSGRVEPGETHAECVAREVLEEVGLRVRPLREVWTCPTHDGGFLLHWWLAEITGGELAPDPDEVAEWRWLSLEEMRELEPRFDADLEFFERVAPDL